MVKINLGHLVKSEWKEELSTAVMRQFGRDWTVFEQIYGASSADRLASVSPALCFSLGEANRQNVKLTEMALNHLQEPREIEITQCKHEVSHFY